MTARDAAMTEGSANVTEKDGRVVIAWRGDNGHELLMEMPPASANSLARRLINAAAQALERRT